MKIPTTEATPEQNAAAGGLTRICPICGVMPGTECRTKGGAPVQGWYLYADDHRSRVRNPGVHSMRIKADDYALVARTNRAAS